MELQKMNGHSRDDGFDGLDAMAEQEEFLPHKPGVKKEMHFTDNPVGLHRHPVCIFNSSPAEKCRSRCNIWGFSGIRAYEQLGNRAFGPPGKMLAGCIITVHNIGAMSSYLFIVKSELPLVIQAFLGKEYNTGEWFLNGNYLIIIVSAFIILPLALMKRLGYLGYTSGFSLSCMVFFLISVIYKKFNIPCPLPDHNTEFFSRCL
ncbi:Sodium-coupled neutral amino acid transporter 3 [Larimichthys crocea]|uniref:Uncharacterized protein n=1 Tax=Larimichthys crocea TaxID=215358 RepID=A0ACD3RBK2_LARCR|nr:Sodium-coupled neutral amino acid transporter 3 [Larimichthys crocea]